MSIRRDIQALLGVMLLIVGGLLAGCSNGSLKLEAEDSGGQAALEMGETITLKLESNPTTGYGWELVGLDEQDVVTLVERKFKSDSMLIGSGGVDTIELETVAQGEVTLELVYWRSWDRDRTPLKTFTYTLTVR